MVQTAQAAFGTLQSFASSSMSSSYQALGNPITAPARIIKILNNSNKDVTVSTDGTTDMDYVPAGGFVLYDLQTNSTLPDWQLSFALATQFYVKGTSGTGNIYLTTVGASKFGVA